MHASDDRIRSAAQLREVVGESVAGVELKVYDHLNHYARGFIERCPFVVVSTADADGNLDASPKGDEPGFVLVEDDRTLVIPDRPGNKLVYGLTNIVSNPHIGILFIVPGTNETLRVNGSAELVTTPELLNQLAARGKPAVLAIRVHVDQCFFHCAKAFLRSKLWKPDSWPAREKVPFGKMFAERLDTDDAAVAETIDAMVEEDYRTNL